MSYRAGDVRPINIAPVARSNERLHREWKEANEKVRVAEERLATAWAATTQGLGSPPDKALLEEVIRLRRECDQRLAAVLEEFTDTRPPKGPSEHPGA